MRLPLRPATGILLMSLLLNPDILVDALFARSALAQGPGEHDSESRLPADTMEALPPDDEEDRVSIFEPYLPEDLTVEVAPEAIFEFGHNLDLDDAEDDDLGVAELVFNLGVGYEPSDRFLAVLATSLTHEFPFVDDGDEDSFLALEIDELYVTLSDLVDDLSLQIGRQNLSSQRDWLYDYELDAVRVFYETDDLVLELSISEQELSDIDLINDGDPEDQSTNLILSGDYMVQDDVALGAYAIFRDERTEEEAELLFLGVRSFGEPVERLAYWLDLGHVRGEEGGHGRQWLCRRRRCDVRVRCAAPARLHSGLCLGQRRLRP